MRKTMKTPTDTTTVGGAPIRKMPTTEDLSRSIQALEHTLSEVLVLLYHVVQANQTLSEAVRRQRPTSIEPTSPRRADLRPLMQVVRAAKDGLELLPGLRTSEQ
jgi:hypothetical protein